jgi:hypothetical protein
MNYTHQGLSYDTAESYLDAVVRDWLFDAGGEDPEYVNRGLDKYTAEELAGELLDEWTLHGDVSRDEVVEAMRRADKERDDWLVCECAYCMAEVPYDHEVPDLSDDAAWADLARLHADDCEWIATRAHLRDA